MSDDLHKKTGPILLLAGPGTGKTYRLAKRIKHLVVESKVSPSEISLVKQRFQTLVNVLAVLQCLQASVKLNSAVLADAQEDNAVDGLLDSEVQFALRDLRIAQRDVLRQQV